MATETETILQTLCQQCQLTEKNNAQSDSQAIDSGIKYATFSLNETDKMTKLLQKLKKLFLEMMPVDLDVNINALFDKECGILFFMKGIMSCKELEKVKLECLQLVDMFCKTFKDNLLLSHVKQFRDLVLEFAISDETTPKEKEKALDALISNLYTKRVMSDLQVNELLTSLCHFEVTYGNPHKRVFQRLYKTMGVICRLYINVDAALVNRVVSTLLKLLERQTMERDSKKIQARMVEGCFDGMRELMYEYSMSQEDNVVSNEKLYNALKHFLDKRFIEEREKGVPRACLKLLAEHGEQLALSVYADYKFWHETFLSWAAQNHPDLHRIGIEGLSTFYIIISKALKGRTEESDMIVFQYFRKYFEETVLESKKNYPAYEVGLAIQGLGQFSSLYASYMNADQVDFIFSIILSRAEDYLKQPKDSEIPLDYLPKYILALGTIVGGIRSIGPQYFTTLQCLCVFLFEKFPTLPPYSHQNCIEALLKTFESLSRNQNHSVSTIDEFLEEVVYQAVIRTCSNFVRMDAELMKDRMSPYAAYFLITYDRYLPIWEGLLQITNVVRYSGIKQAHLKEIATKAFDSFILSLLKLFDKLNFSTYGRGEILINDKMDVDEDNAEKEAKPITLLEVIGMDPQSSLRANKPKDFQVFLNVVDLYQDLLPRVDKEHFIRWAVPLTKSLMLHSSQYPLVSGFYKLLTLCLNLCNEVDFFKDTQSTNDGVADERNQCFKLLGKFLREVLMELGQYKGDLQIACLYLTLAIPIQLLPELSPLIAPALQILFSVGQNCIPLALAGINALKLWSSKLQPSELLEPLLLKTIPCLNKFLHSVDQCEGADSPEELLELRLKKQTTKSIVRHTVQAEAGEKDTALSQLQQEILIFLAGLDMSTCLALANVDDSEMAEQAVSWTSSKLLRFYLPFSDMKVSIYLELFLPRVVELALYSSDRHTRVTACEFLHSTILVILGTDVQVAADGKERVELRKLFSKLLPPLLALGCDTDLLVQQLFQPLVLQITHYFSSRTKIKSKETEILLQTLMDGITHEKDMTIRDFAAVSLKEFVIWSIKQTSTRDVENLSLIISPILNNVYYFCLHPNPFKRLGGALVVNCLYTVLREENYLIDRFFLELLFYLVSSLQLVGPGEAVLGIKHQTKQAINHIERVLKERCTIFNQPSSERQKPPDFTGVLLKDAVNWLLSLCSAPNTDCRNTCMDLVLHLAEYITGVRCSADVLKNYQVIHGNSSIVKLCEACGSGEKDMSLPMQKPGDDPVSHQTWLRHLLASLECYIWILEHNLASPAQIFCSASPNIFIASVNFIKDEVKQADLPMKMLLSLSELEELEEMKCKILINIIDLIYHIIEKGKHEISNRTKFEELLSPLRCAEFWQVVCLLVLKPVQVGFSLKTHILTSELEGKLSRFLCVFRDKVPTMENELISSLGSFMTQCHTDLKTLTHLNDTVKQGATTNQINYIKGLCSLYKADLNKNMAKTLMLLHEPSGLSILKKIFDSLFETRNGTVYTLQIPPSSMEYLEALMTLVYLTGVQVETVFEFLNNGLPVKDEKLKAVSSQGRVFYKHLKTSIIEFLLQTPDKSISVTMTAVDILKLCHTFLDAFYRKPDLRQRYSCEVSAALMAHWPVLLLHEVSNLLAVMDIVAYIANITKKEQTLKTLTKWICSHLTSPDNSLSIKRRGLDIIPPLLIRGGEKAIDSLRTSFSILCQQNFPIKSSEYPSGSTQLTEYKTFFLRLLSILEKTGSFMLLEFIASVASKDGEHVCLDVIQSTVATLVARLSPAKQLEVINLIFKYFTDEETLPEIKINYILQFVVPMLQAASCETVEQFFITHVGLLGTIVSTPPVLGESLSDFRASKQLMPHICAFSLVELLYSQLPKESLLATSPVGKQFSPDPSKVMSQVFLTKAYNARSDESTVSPSWRNLYMQYQCCAFKAAISITCCLFPDPKAFEKKYTMFIFTVSTNGNIWSKIVDCSKKFDLKMDFEEIPKRKKKLVCIRKSARIASTSSRDVGVSLASSTVQYPASQKLFDSTLCEDVSRFDLSHVDLRSYDESQLNSTTVQHHSEQEEVMLELDAINSNDCMAVMCALVKHCSSGYEGDNNGQLPDWMKNIRKVLCSASQHKNVKLFIIKLMLNVEEVFKPFAKHWLDPMCMAIVDGSLGEAMNYVLSDTVSMLLSWHDVAIPNSLSEVNLASNLLELLINLAYHQRQDITKHNLELIKTLVEVWKPILNVKHQMFFNICQLSSAEPKLQIGLQVVAILLANKVLPWNDIGSGTFIDNLLDKHFMDTSRRTNQISAEIIGMILKWAHEPEPKPSLLIDEEAFKKRVERNLKTLYKDKNLFFPSLYTIHKYYNPIVDIFLHNLLYEFLRLVGDFKIKSLELISSRIDTMEDCVREITNLGLDRRMTDRGTGEQEHALQLVVKLVPVMTAKQALPYVCCIPQVLAEAGPDCRAKAYEVLMQVLRNNKEGPQGELLAKLSIGGLMSGLYDQDATLQQKVLDFWSSSDIQLPQAAADRFVTLARKLFVKDSAHHFLSTLLQLMLEATVLTPDYNQVIFERGLSDCKFEKYALHDSWRTRNATMMTPLFAETLSSQVMSQSVMTNSLVPGHLRATQNFLAFKPTAELQDDYDDEDIPGTSSSALMVSLSETLNDDGGVSAIPLFTRENNSPQQSSSPRKYRFMSDQKRIRNSFARREIQLRAKREQVVKEHKAKQEGQVKVYRTYRYGDFPDIQITSSAVIKPLQVLAKFDQTIARQLFVAVFMGIENDLPPEKCAPFITDITVEFQSIFEGSGHHVPMLSGALMEIALEQDNIELNPDVISSVCSATGLASVGCLIIEKYLKTEAKAGPSTSKRARLESDGSSRKNEWLKLAELYQSLGERDVVLAVIQEALGPENDLLKAAVQEEATLKLMDASNHYRTCTSKYPDLKDFTTEAYCRCLERLSMWEDMNTWVHEKIGNENLQPLWDDPWNQEKLLPWLMKSEVHEILEKNDPKEFASVLLSWSKDKDKLTFLKRCFNEELSLVNLIGGEIERSRLFSRHVLQNFLKDWSVLSTLLPQLRGQKLSQLHSINEIIMFADVLQSQDGNEAILRMHKLCDKWKINQPKPIDSLLLWETRTVYRCFFGKQSWRKRLQELETRVNADLELTLKRALFSQELSLIDLAITQKNINVALKFIRKTRNVSIDKDLELRHKIAVSRAKWLLAEFVDTLKDKLECNLTALEDLRVAVESAGPNLLQGEQIRAKCELAELAWSASKLLRQHPNLLLAVNTTEGWMKRYLSPNLDELNCNYVVSSLEEYCQTVAMQAVERAKEDNSLSSITADAMMHVAKFCREIIQREQAEQAVTANLKNQAGLFTTCLLGAMKRGSKQARMMFPCLLQLEVIAQDCNLTNTFKKEVADVPEWMFLGWINQLLAYMDTKMVEVLDDLLERVATKYPKAVQLPFQFTQERIAMQNELQVSSKVRGLLRSLEKILELDVISKKMLKAFSHVAQPEMILMNHLQHIIKNLENSKQLTELYNEMIEDVFPSTKDLPSSLCGIAFERIERKHKSTIQRILTPLMANRGNVSWARNELQSMIATLNQDLKKMPKPTALDAYCPFLKHFRGDLYAGFEIPGQYTGDNIPLPHHHILVSSFDPTVQIMTSIRWPVKLNIIGNNGVVYGYIIKTGEDLRQDERVGQLLRIMNGALTHNVECNALKLSIHTYQVVPITNRLGIIQFVKDCSPYKEFMDSAATQHEIREMRKLKEVTVCNFVMGSRNAAAAYEKLYASKNRAETIDYITKWIDAAPQDLLCRAFSNLSSSPEGLYWLRQCFVKSLGAMSIAHWLLGIGDRHLSNMLISLRTGAAIGIDFGHAFGSATQILPVVEFVPFRLTNMMLNFMGPLGHAGLLRSVMIKSLRAFREHHELLMNTMQVFVLEPSLDWQEHATKLAYSFVETDSDPNMPGPVENYAQQKVRLMRHKIEGALPALVMEEEFITSKKGQDKRRRPQYLEVLNGHPKHNLRMKLRKAIETKMDQEFDLESLLKEVNGVEDQVDCLIDQATDLHILGKTYYGWAPWI